MCKLDKSVEQLLADCPHCGERINHCLGIIKDSAQWHRTKWMETKDRYHLGQFKTYQRIAKRVENLHT